MTLLRTTTRLRCDHCQDVYWTSWMNRPGSEICFVCSNPGTYVRAVL